MTPLFEALLTNIPRRLRLHGIDHRLIGAAALAAHGVTRSTADVDLLVADGSVLSTSMWADLVPDGFELTVSRGDDEDPLLGVVRIDADDLSGQVDLVVPRGRWVAAIARSPGPKVALGQDTVHAVTASDLVLLKLYAGGPQDRADIERLLGIQPDGALRSAVDEAVVRLPEECRALWARLR